MAFALRQGLQRAAAAATGSAARFTPARGFAAEASWVKTLNANLEDTDPALFDILEHEKRRQRDSVCLIPSEVRPASPTTRRGLRFCLELRVLLSLAHVNLRAELHI